MARCTKADQCRARCTNLRQLQGLTGRGSLHNRHCQSKRIWPAATASAPYGNLHADCTISTHAELGTAQVAAQGELRQREVPQQALAGAYALATKLLPHVQGTRALLQCKQQMGSLWQRQSVAEKRSQQ